MTMTTRTYLGFKIMNEAVLSCVVVLRISSVLCTELSFIAMSGAMICFSCTSYELSMKNNALAILSNETTTKLKAEPGPGALGNARL